MGCWPPRALARKLKVCFKPGVSSLRVVLSQFVPVLSRAAMAVGIAGIFMETHPDPDKALSDGPNAWPLGKMQALLENLIAFDEAAKRGGFIEDQL